MSGNALTGLLQILSLYVIALFQRILSSILSSPARCRLMMAVTGCRPFRRMFYSIFSWLHFLG